MAQTRKPGLLIAAVLLVSYGFVLFLLKTLQPLYFLGCFTELSDRASFCDSIGKILYIVEWPLTFLGYEAGGYFFVGLSILGIGTILLVMWALKVTSQSAMNVNR